MLVSESPIKVVKHSSGGIQTPLQLVTPTSTITVTRTLCALLFFTNLIFVGLIDWSAYCDFAAPVIYMHSYNTRYRLATLSYVNTSPSSFITAQGSSLNRSTVLDIEPPTQPILPTSNPHFLLTFSVPPMTALKFSTIDIPLWFHRFGARYLGLH